MNIVTQVKSSLTARDVKNLSVKTAADLSSLDQDAAVSGQSIIVWIVLSIR